MGRISDTAVPTVVVGRYGDDVHTWNWGVAPNGIE